MPVLPRRSSIYSNNKEKGDFIMNIEKAKTNPKAYIDNIIANVKSYDSDKVPKELVTNINKWKWGGYG